MALRKRAAGGSGLQQGQHPCNGSAGQRPRRQRCLGCRPQAAACACAAGCSRESRQRREGGGARWRLAPEGGGGASRPQGRSRMRPCGRLRRAALPMRAQAGERPSSDPRNHLGCCGPARGPGAHAPPPTRRLAPASDTSRTSHPSSHPRAEEVPEEECGRREPRGAGCQAGVAHQGQAGHCLRLQQRGAGARARRARADVGPDQVRTGPRVWDRGSKGTAAGRRRALACDGSAGTGGARAAPSRPGRRACALTLCPL